MVLANFFIKRKVTSHTESCEFANVKARFLRRRLGVQASQDPGRPGHLANPRLIFFYIYFSLAFSHFH
jgi:hypothetical protein